MGILDRVRDRLARRAGRTPAERAPATSPSPARAAAPAAWRSAAPTPSIIPTSTPAAKTAGLHRDLTVNRRHVTLEPLGHEVTTTIGGLADGLVAVPSPVAPPRAGVVARPHAGAPTRAGSVQRHEAEQAPEAAPIAPDVTDIGPGGAGPVDAGDLTGTAPATLPGVPLEGRPSPASTHSPTSTSVPIRRVDRSPTTAVSRAAASSPRPGRTEPPPTGSPAPVRTDHADGAGAPVVHRRTEPGASPSTPSTPGDGVVPTVSTPGSDGASALPVADHDGPSAPGPSTVATETPEPSRAVPIQRAGSNITSAPTVGLRPPLPSTPTPRPSPSPASARPDQPAVDRRVVPPASVPPSAPRERSSISPRPTPGFPTLPVAPPRAAPSPAAPLVGETHVLRAADDNDAPAPTESSGGFESLDLDETADWEHPAAAQTETSPPDSAAVPIVDRRAAEALEPHAAPQPAAETSTTAVPTSVPSVARQATPAVRAGAPTTSTDSPMSPRPGLGPALAPEERTAFAMAAEPDESPDDAPAARPVDIARQASSRPPLARPHGGARSAPRPTGAEPAEPAAAPIAVAPAAEPDGLELLLQRVAEPSVAGSGPAPAPTAAVAHEIRIDRAADVDRATTTPEGADAGELADRLYERIERRLRNDLLQEVERRGQLSRWG